MITHNGQPIIRDAKPQPLALTWVPGVLSMDGEQNITAHLPSGRWVSVLRRRTGFIGGTYDTETALCDVVEGKRQLIIATSYDVRNHIKPEWTEADLEAAIVSAGNWWTK